MCQLCERSWLGMHNLKWNRGVSGFHREWKWLPWYYNESRQPSTAKVNRGRVYDYKDQQEKRFRYFGTRLR